MKSNNTQGNPYHDENGQFTSGGGSSKANKGNYYHKKENSFSNKLADLGFGPGESLAKEDFETPHPYIGGKNPNITTNKEVQRRFEQMGFKDKKNPSKLSLDDFKLVNSSRKFAIEQDLNNLQALYELMLNEDVGSQAKKDYDEAYEKFWTKWGDSWKGTNSDDRPAKKSLSDMLKDFGYDVYDPYASFKKK